MISKAFSGADWNDEYNIAKGIATELLDDYLEVTANLEKDIEAKSEAVGVANAGALKEANNTLRSLDPNCKVPPKKVRNRLSNEVAAYLDSLFKICSHPTRTERRLIGEHCGISLHQVTQWFTNRRFREPKGVSSDDIDAATMFIPSPMASPESMDDYNYHDTIGHAPTSYCA
ncbi:Mating-type protein [Yarrowia sp. C11]|nr:Mating-type protein [Yarrowia sp. C11]